MFGFQVSSPTSSCNIIYKICYLSMTNNYLYSWSMLIVICRRIMWPIKGSIWFYYLQMCTYGSFLSLINNPRFVPHKILLSLRMIFPLFFLWECALMICSLWRLLLLSETKRCFRSIDFIFRFKFYFGDCPFCMSFPTSVQISPPSLTPVLLSALHCCDQTSAPKLITATQFPAYNHFSCDHNLGCLQHLITGYYLIAALEVKIECHLMLVGSFGVAWVT